MPRYRLHDHDTGDTLLVEGDAPPTEADAAELFTERRKTPRPLSSTQLEALSAKATTQAQQDVAARAYTDSMKGSELTQAIYHDVPAAIGTSLHRAGDRLWEGGVNVMANLMDQNVSPRAGAWDATPEDRLASQEMSSEAAKRTYPPAVQAYITGAEGVVKTLPQLGIAAVNPVAGGLSFGFTPEGFDPMGAAIGLAAPVIGRYSGAVTELMASKLGVSQDVALQLLNKMGGATGAAAAISAPELYRVSQMPEGDERDRAIIDLSGNAAVMGVMGMMGHTKRFDSTQAVVDRGNAQRAFEAQDLARRQARGTSQPADEGAPVPTWEATEMARANVESQGSKAEIQPKPEISPDKVEVKPVGEILPVEPSTTAIDPRAVPVSELPVKQIKLSKEVENFKEGANPDTGVVKGQQLEGGYERLGTAPIVVWRRLNGDLEVITGRHRLDLARRSGEKTIPSQVVDEAKGFTKDMALTFDAEANIRDGQGSVQDYAHYFKHSPQLTPEAAQSRGLLSRAKGKAGFDLGRHATDDLYALWQDGKVSEGQALAITRASPGNADAQRIGIKFALAGKSPEFLANVIKASQAEAGTRAQSLDLFGNDDAAMQTMAEQATRASKFQQEIAEQIRAVQGAAKRPEIARQMGVDVKDPAGIVNKIGELKAELERWENWPLQPDLVAKVRGEQKAGFQLAQPESVAEQKARLAQEQAQRDAQAAKDKLAADAAKPLQGGTGDLGQGDLLNSPEDLFAPPTPGTSAVGGINTGALGESGMGGAKPGEFRNAQQTPTSIKNTVTDAERVKRGLPPAMDAARKEFGTTWDEAMARLDHAPDAAELLVQELKAKPRAVSDVENALLLQRQVQLQNEYGKFTRELAQAWDDSKSFPNRLADVEDFKARVAATSDALQELYDVNRAVGTEQGRGLATRKMLAYEDYTLANMEMEKRAAKGGLPLSDAERAELVKAQQRIEQTQKAFDDYREQQEAARANRMTDEAIAEMEAELKRRPNYDPRIVKVAEEIVTKLEKQADAARLRLKEKFRRTNTGGADPTIIYDLGVIGAAKIARMGLDFAKFSAEMVKELGDDVKEYLPAAWERANLHLENEGAKYGDKAPQVKNILRKRDATSKRENVIAGLKKGKAEGIPVQMEGDYIRKLAEGFVEGGITKREPLIDAVHKVLTEEIGLELTRRETMDAISGYGKFKPLNPDAIKATLRDLRGQMQQVAKLEDIQARTPLKKTGVQRREPSNEERRLLQQVNEAKRRFGVVVDDPARQLKSAVDAIKTRLKNSIADLEYQLNTKQRIVKTKSPSPTDLESQALELKRDELRGQLDALVPKPGLTVEQQIAQVSRGIERSIADYEARIKAGDTASRTSKPAMSTPALEALRARRDALRAEWQELRDLANPELREQQALAALKTRLLQSTASYKERLAKADFAPKPKRETRLDAEALKLKAENEIAKREFHRGLIMDRLANRSTGQKVYAGVKESLNLTRNVITSWDLSAAGRQGGIIGIGNPHRFIANLKPQLQSLASERAAVAVEQEILSRPNAPLYKQSKLYLAPHEALHLSAMEEQTMSRIAGKVPGVRASNRAYITYLNKLRADTFDSFDYWAKKFGWDLKPEEHQALASYINVATGRGELGKASAAAETLATVFFSPRLVASRFQFLLGQPLYRGTWRTRTLIAAEYAKFFTGISAIIGLGLLAGATVEDDPRSSDFGKLRFGDTRVDILGGLGQNTVLLSRLASGQTMTSKGEVKDIRGDVPYGHRTSADVIAQFLRSKLSPVVGGAVDIASGKNVVGDPVTPGTVALNMTVPLSFRDIYEVMKDQGMAAGTALGILSLFGFGLQHYDPRSTPEVDAIMKELRGLSKEQREQTRQELMKEFSK